PLYAHGVGTIVPAALHDRVDLRAGFSDQVAPFETHTLGTQMTRCMVRNLLRHLSEIGVEAGFIADGPQILAWVENRLSYLARPLAIFGARQGGVLHAQHHGTGGIDRHDLGASVDVRL